MTNSPDDPELMKLKTDLEEVIELTTELVRTQTQPKKEVGTFSLNEIIIKVMNKLFIIF